jgi:hypothetical protein
VLAAVLPGNKVSQSPAMEDMMDIADQGCFPSHFVLEFEHLSHAL